MKILKVPLVIFFFAFHSSDIFVPGGATRIPWNNDDNSDSDGTTEGRRLDLDLSEGEPLGGGKLPETENGWRIKGGDNCDGCKDSGDDDDYGTSRTRHNFGARHDNGPFPIVAGYVQHTIKSKRQSKSSPGHHPSTSISMTSSAESSHHSQHNKNYDDGDDSNGGNMRKQPSRRSVHLDLGLDHGDHFHHIPIVGLGYGFGQDYGYGYHHHHDYDDYHHHGHHHHHHH